MERSGITGKYLILLGLFTDALCLLSGRGPGWTLWLMTVLLELSGVCLVFKNRKAKQ